jgi:hypothetical protein
MLTAKMFVIQTRNYILKCVNSSILLPKWHVIKTKLSLGEFGKLPATLGVSNPGLTEPASMFVIKSLKTLSAKIVISLIC